MRTAGPAFLRHGQERVELVYLASQALRVRSEMRHHVRKVIHTIPGSLGNTSGEEAFDSLKKLRDDNPAVFWRAVISLLPKQVEAEVDGKIELSWREGRET